MSKFYQMFAYLRKREGLTQQEIADKLKVSKSTIGMYEQNRREPDHDMLEAIADTFNVSIDFLLGKQQDEMPPYYYDKNARDAAEFLYKNPMYKVLFDASRKVKPEDINFVKKMIDRMAGDDSNDSGC